MAITDPHILPEDVRLVPIAELPERVRERLAPHEGGVAVVRPGSRLPVKLVDADAADLLGRFTVARPIVDVVLELSAERGADAHDTLRVALPLLGHFVTLGLLVEEGSPRHARIGATLGEGEAVGEWRVSACVQSLADTEVYQARDASGRVAALKIARGTDERTRATLAAESEVLRRLAGDSAPALLDAGEHDGRRFVAMEWCAGARVSVVAAELRALAGAERRLALARLAASVARAFASVHARGVVHGDVHPGNVLVDAQGRVRLVDFGLACIIDAPTSARRPRAGVPHFHEPELARALRSGATPPAVCVRGEVYALGALLHFLAAGAHHLDFALDRAEALRQIEEDAPRAFAACGAEPFPALERVLHASLAKSPADRFETMGAMADALELVRDACEREVPRTAPAVERASAMRPRADELLATLGVVEREPGDATLRVATPWIVDGAAGIGLALLRLATHRDDPILLAHADLWTARAESMLASDHEHGASDGDDPLDARDGRSDATHPRAGIESVAAHDGPAPSWGDGRNAPWSAASGVHLVRALVADATGDAAEVRRAVARFDRAATAPCRWLDLTIGRAGTLAACAQLVETLADPRALASVRAIGDRVHSGLWSSLTDASALDSNTHALNLGVAHGWGGVLLATLRWSAARGLPIEPHVRARVGELAALAAPVGRGARWRWRNIADPNDATERWMAGWCNGSAGLAHLWLAAHAALGDRAYADLALAAAWHAWEDAESRDASLCCGYAGRAYALLAVHRATADRAWLDRARALATRALDHSRPSRTRAGFSLYKGALGVALLLAEIDEPSGARMPMFEGE